MDPSESPNSLGRGRTLAYTAELLNISVSQAYSLVRSGELPAIQIGARGHWRIERSVLELYIEAMYEEARRLSLGNQSDYASLLELSIGRPRVIFREENGTRVEPYETVQVDVDEPYSGTVVEKMAQRKGEMTDMRPSGGGKVRLTF